MNNIISFRFFILLNVFGIIFGTKNLYSQKSTKLDIHTITVKTADSYVKTNIIDFSKKKINTKEYLIYYWYNDNTIHLSTGGYSGKLLHKSYTEYYSSGNLKEQGNYYYGLRAGLWKKWYASGILNTVTKYRNGIKSGPYREYDKNNNLTLCTNYRKGQINGKYTIYKDGKIIAKKKYKNGVEILPKEKEEKKPKEKKEKNVKPTDSKEKKEFFLTKFWKQVFKSKKK